MLNEVLSMTRLPLPFSLAMAFFSLLCIPPLSTPAKDPAGTKKFVRFQTGDRIAYGIVNGNNIVELKGDLFGKWQQTDRSHKLSSVRILIPSVPRQVIAMAGNYRSHLAENVVTTVTTTTKVTTNQKTKETTVDSQTETETREPGKVPAKFQIPQPFLKTISSLAPQGANIVLPKGSDPVHFEAEMVIVIGRHCRNVSKKDAGKYILGVTCGNDISARTWQKNDVQWWRAKGSATFGPVGPFITSGLNYDDLRLQLRVNGKTMQDERTKNLIHNVPATVSFLSKHMDLYPGDLIFTGTPGKTSALKPGDVVEVELEGVGILKNPVVAEE